VNGLLVIDKPGGMTSHDVVGRLRRITGEKSIGHLGTLDPMATGVLPLLLGKFTRLAQFFSAAEKSYTGIIRFGFATDTYDAEGEPASVPMHPELTFEQVRHVAARFYGTMQQMPPAFSAKKIAGKPAYKLARAGDQAAFTLSISAGGYVRSIAHEMGQELGCGAHLSSLRRTRAGVFTLSQAHKLDELQQLAGDLSAVEEKFVHPRSLLPEMPAVTADAQVLGRLRNGAQANLPEFSSAPLIKVFAGQRYLAAIVQRVAGTLFQPVVVLG
jgi:tRNA pseudouridine55 synthase